MDLIVLVLVAAVIGFALWAITTYIPMPSGWARALQVFSLIVLILWLVSHFVHVPNVLR